mmetsp:Transcript_19069/g.38892  ORF Transcript_19069/g.38892 Transcript_19069/m.38892 type:complete len:147 (-) Transcript_19069:144-584(-)
MNKNINKHKALDKLNWKTENRAVFILIDTNFIYFSLKNKINIFKSFVECLYSKCILCTSECVLLELERLGPKFRLALRVLREKKIIKLTCSHSSSLIYADDCILHTIKNNKNFLVATCDKDLKRRIRKISGVPVISIKKKKFVVLK